MTTMHAIRIICILLCASVIPCAAEPPASQPGPPLAQVSPTVAALQDMARAADLLRRSDPGQATQSLQTDALEQLRRLMDQVRRQQEQQSQQQSTGQPSSAEESASPQQDSQDRNKDGSQDSESSSAGRKDGRGRQSPQQGSGQRSGQGASEAASDSRLPGEQAPTGAAGLLTRPGQVEAWGFLPPDQRREILQGMQAEPPPRYRTLTERYWRLLNESAGER